MSVHFELVQDDVWLAHYEEWKLYFLKSTGFINVIEFCLDEKFNLIHWLIDKADLIHAFHQEMEIKMQLDENMYLHPFLIQQIAHSISPTCAMAISKIIHECTKRRMLENKIGNLKYEVCDLLEHIQETMFKDTNVRNKTLDLYYSKDSSFTDSSDLDSTF